MKENLQNKISIYKEEYNKKFEDLEEMKEIIYQKVKDTQLQKDKIKEKLESSSPSKIIKEKAKILSQCSKLNQKVISIDELKPIEFEKLTFDEEHLKFQSFKFTIPKDKSMSEFHTLYDTEFWIRINDDLIGLFKSFDILMESYAYGCMEFEYEIFLVKDDGKPFRWLALDNGRDWAKEHEDRGTIKSVN